MACLLAVWLAAPALAAEVRNVRVWAGPEHTRAVFDLTGPVEYRLFELSAPERIVLDLKGVSLAPGFAPKGSDGLLKGVRAGKHGRTDARIVLDVADGVRPRSFLLAPGEGMGHRLVLDLYPAKAAAAPARTVAPATGGTPRDIVIAIDAGHGGVDPGAIGAKGTREKDITLQVARELAAQVNRTPGLKAVLIRDGDHFIPLEARYRKAREARADLFISIHADAFTNKDARGSSVWVLSPRGASSQAARWLADRENRADLVGGITLTDKDDTLAQVLLDLSQGATMGASNAVAEQVLAGLKRIGPTHRNHVERANFVVLRSPDVPSILVETAFITNPAEEARLKTAAHQKRLASAILEGVSNHFQASPPPGSLFAEQARARRNARASQYVVSRGDTLSGIAARHGVSLSSLRAANTLAGETVRVGEVLSIPSS